MDNISFGYIEPALNYSNDSVSWEPPVLFSNNNHDDYGVRLVDINNDGFDDLIIGAKGYKAGSEQGRAYLYYGGPR